MQNLPFLLIAGLILCAFFTISFASQKLRLPSVLIYIVLGGLVSSLFFKNELIHIVAEIGIVLLFFVLGLEFPLDRMITISKRIWPAGFLDIIVNLGGAMTVAMLFGLDFVAAFIIGSVAYATSSPISAEIERLLLPVRDLTLPFFFFWFGTTLQFGEGIPFVGLLIALVPQAVLGKIVTAYAGSRWFGLSPKVSCRAAFSMVHRGEFSAIIAGMALPQLRIFSGAYILITAFIGVYLFGRASDIANWYQAKGSSGLSAN